MKVSLLLIRKLKEFEGLRLEAYRDVAGVWTIGYGHTGKDVKPGDRISEYWATDLLKRDVERVSDAVEALQVARTEGQMDALVSFAFNCGIGALKRSTLLKVIREGGSKRAVKREFRRWVNAGGRPQHGLQLRREWEARRFFE